MNEEKYEDGTYTKLPNVFFDTCDLPETAQILYLRLYRHTAYRGGKFVGSIRKLSNLARLSKSTVDRMVKKLADAQLLTIGYEQSEEQCGEVMAIKLNIDALWALNRYHSNIAPVPIWDSTIPEMGQGLSNEGQEIVNEGHDIPTTSTKKQGMNREEKGINPNNPNEREQPTSQQGEEHPSFTLSDDALFIHQWFCEKTHRANKSISEDAARHCTLLATKIKTQEAFNRLYECTKTDILNNQRMTTKKVHLGNMVNMLDTWEMEEEAAKTPHWYTDPPEVIKPSDFLDELAWELAEQLGEAHQFTSLKDELNHIWQLTTETEETFSVLAKGMYELMVDRDEDGEEVLMSLEEAKGHVPLCQSLCDYLVWGLTGQLGLPIRKR